MQIITWAQARRMKFSNLRLALGTFDGLHKGHMALVEAVKQEPGESAVFTFDALPTDVFNAAHPPMRLMTLDEKIAAFEKTGIDTFIAHFDSACVHRPSYFSAPAARCFPPVFGRGYN